MRSVSRVIGLNEVPRALDQNRRFEGPPRIVVHLETAPRRLVFFALD
jgi:hypothetical protein